MQNTLVKVEHLSHKYAAQWAVKDISFEINAKGVTGLLGSNGAGKSTTMNIICGVLKQTKGDVFINGVNMKEDAVNAKKQIGFMPQKLPLYLDFTVKEYLTYCAHLKIDDSRAVAKAVDAAAERCGITHFYDRLLSNLSGGYQQRVGVAQAIVHNPAFVVLDEPTNGLDPNQILEVRHLVRDIATERSVLLSTHILSEVQATCQDIIMIDQGQMVFSGTLDMFDNYIEPNSVVISLDNPPAESSLIGLEGIFAVETLSQIKFRLRYDGEQHTVKRLAETCISNGWGLIGLNIEKSSMNDVFARLSKKNG